MFNDVYVVSLSDIVNHPFYEQYKDDEEGLDKMLFIMGMDTSKPIEETINEHRSDISGEVVNCPRYVGRERTDTEWKYLKMKAIGALM